MSTFEGIRLINLVEELFSAGVFAVFAVLGIVAFAHASRASAGAFVVIGRLTKPVWLMILGLSTFTLVLGAITLGRMSFLAYVGIVAIGIYLADVRRRVEESGTAW